MKYLTNHGGCVVLKLLDEQLHCLKGLIPDQPEQNQG